jgi:transcription elongation factor Elf1
MKIKKILSQHRNDFSAEMECEHCGHTAIDRHGYDDAHYHQRVIPAMHCKGCGKNRAGELEHTAADVTPVTI